MCSPASSTHESVVTLQCTKAAAAGKYKIYNLNTKQVGKLRKQVKSVGHTVFQHITVSYGCAENHGPALLDFTVMIRFIFNMETSQFSSLLPITVMLLYSRTPLMFGYRIFDYGHCIFGGVNITL